MIEEGRVCKKETIISNRQVNASAPSHLWLRSLKECIRVGLMERRTYPFRRVVAHDGRKSRGKLEGESQKKIAGKQKSGKDWEGKPKKRYIADILFQ